MASQLLETLGFIAWTVAALLLGGAAAACIVGGTCLLFMGYATDDEAVARQARRALHGLAWPRRAWRARTVRRAGAITAKG